MRRIKFIAADRGTAKTQTATEVGLLCQEEPEINSIREELIAATSDFIDRLRLEGLDRVEVQISGHVMGPWLLDRKETLQAVNVMISVVVRP